jgi:hypothetical protein
MQHQLLSTVLEEHLLAMFPFIQFVFVDWLLIKKFSSVD